MASKIKKIIALVIVVLSIATIATVLYLNKLDDNAIEIQTTAPQTTGPAIIDDALVGKWLRQEQTAELDYNGATVYRILQLQLNANGSSILYHVGYTINVDKETYVEKGVEWAIANHTAEEIETKLKNNGCTSLIELMEQEYDAYANYKGYNIIFMGYWETIDGVFYDWGQGSKKEDGDKTPYNINGDVLTIGSLKYTRVTYPEGE